MTARVTWTAVLALAMTSGCAADSVATHVELLAGIRGVAPDRAWALETRAFRAVSDDVLARNGYSLIVTPISDRSIGEVPLVQTTTPNESFFGLNHEDAEHLRTEAKKRAKAALAQLEHRARADGRTEIINAIVAAVDRFEADRQYTHRVLVVVSSGFEQSSIVNMADYNLKLNAPVMRQRLIDHLKATGQIVDLRGTVVCLLGTTNGDGNWADYNRLKGVRQFWSDYFTAAGATYVGVGPTIESCAPFTSGSRT